MALAKTRGNTASAPILLSSAAMELVLPLRQIWLGLLAGFALALAIVVGQPTTAAACTGQHCDEYWRAVGSGNWRPFYDKMDGLGGGGTPRLTRAEETALIHGSPVSGPAADLVAGGTVRPDNLVAMSPEVAREIREKMRVVSGAGMAMRKQAKLTRGRGRSLLRGNSRDRGGSIGDAIGGIGDVMDFFKKAKAFIDEPGLGTGTAVFGALDGLGETGSGRSGYGGSGLGRRYGAGLGHPTLGPAVLARARATRLIAAKRAAQAKLAAAPQTS